MEQSDFNSLIQNLCIQINCTDKNEECISSNISVLYQLYKTTELRDFAWIINDKCNLYGFIWCYVTNIWKLVSPLIDHKSNKVDVPTNITIINDINNEYYLLEIWNYMITLSEFDQDYFIKSNIFDDLFIRKLFYQIFLFSSYYIPMKVKNANYIIQYLKNVLHWIYKYQINHRILIKSLLYNYLISDEYLNEKIDGLNTHEYNKLSIHGMSSTDAGNIHIY